MSRAKILSSPAYWFEKSQNELFRQFHYYMERENINQTQLAERLGITRGRVSQILRGESNFTMKTLIELGLFIGVIPKISYRPLDEEIKSDLESYDAKQINKLGKKTVLITKKTSSVDSKNLPINFSNGSTTLGDGLSAAGLPKVGNISYNLTPFGEALSDVIVF
ncbi:MAG: helix-turn-helix transcriptional regulator [Bacteroidota bacterium]